MLTLILGKYFAAVVARRELILTEVKMVYDLLAAGEDSLVGALQRARHLRLQALVHVYKELVVALKGARLRAMLPRAFYFLLPQDFAHQLVRGHVLAQVTSCAFFAPSVGQAQIAKEVVLALIALHRLVNQPVADAAAEVYERCVGATLGQCDDVLHCEIVFLCVSCAFFEDGLEAI